MELVPGIRRGSGGWRRQEGRERGEGRQGRINRFVRIAKSLCKDPDEREEFAQQNSTHRMNAIRHLATAHRSHFVIWQHCICWLLIVLERVIIYFFVKICLSNASTKRISLHIYLFLSVSNPSGKIRLSWKMTQNKVNDCNDVVDSFHFE